MTNATDPARRLTDLGDALLAATAADLHREHVASVAPARRVRPRRRRQTLAAVLLALVAVPGVAVAAGALISDEEVARSLPSGTLALLGSDPTCTTVRADVEFDCTLAKAPAGDIGAGNWARVVEPSVGEDDRFNGGCRSQNAAGTRWRCYIGREAIRQDIIGPALLGAPSTGPGVG